MTKRESIELCMVVYDPKMKSDNQKDTALLIEKIKMYKKDKLWKLTVNIPND